MELNALRRELSPDPGASGLGLMCHRRASFALAIGGQAGFLISLQLKSNTPDDGNEQPQPDGFPGQSITSPTLQEKQKKYIFVYVKRDEKIHKLITSKGNEQRPNENWPQPTGQEVIRRQCKARKGIENQQSNLKFIRHP